MKKTVPARPMTRLQVGDVFELRPGEEYLVWYVNECRAAATPMKASGVRFQTRFDKEVEFKTARDSINIAPNSEVKILRRLTPRQMDDLDNPMKGSMAKKAKGKKEAQAPRAGKFGKVLGHSATAVVRTMGKLGWTFQEIRAWFDREKVDVADNTIRIQMSAGRNGKQDGAPVESELKKSRPEVKEDKPAKKKSSKKEAPVKKAKKAKKDKAPKPAKKDDEDYFEDEEESSEE